MTDQQIMAKWRSFPVEQRNIPFAEFRKTLKKLTDPAGIKRDLAEIHRRRINHRMNKSRIDSGLRNG